MVPSATLPALTHDLAVANNPANADGPAVTNESSAEDSGFTNRLTPTDNPAAANGRERIPRTRQNREVDVDLGRQPDTGGMTGARAGEPAPAGRVRSALVGAIGQPAGQRMGPLTVVDVPRSAARSGAGGPSDEPPPPTIGTTWPAMGWRHHALCRDTDPELFFPEGTSGPAERQTAEAKAICRHCAVRADCLSWALDTGQDAGVWGGLSEKERRALRPVARLTVRTS